MDPAKGKCASCGKELPPLSECGGFYNIMPEAKLAQVRRPAEEAQPGPTRGVPAASPAGYSNPPAGPTQQASNPTPPFQQRPVVQEKKSSLVPVLLIALALCLVALIVTAIIAISSGAKLKALSEKSPDRSERTTEATREQEDDTTAPPQNNSSSVVAEDTTEPVEDPTEPDEPILPEEITPEELAEILSEGNIVFSYEFISDDPSAEMQETNSVADKDGRDISSCFDFDKKKTPSVNQTSYLWVFRENVVDTEAGITDKTMVNASIMVNKDEGGKLQLIPNLTIINKEAFHPDPEDSSPRFTWQFYNDKKEVYEDVTEDIGNVDGNVIKLTDDALEENVRLRCLITMPTITAEDEPGELTVILSGIPAGGVR